MKKSVKFEWTAEAQDAFDNMKKVLSTSPVLVTTHNREPMLLYIAATSCVVSTVLVVEGVEAGKVITLVRYSQQHHTTRSSHMMYGGKHESCEIILLSIRLSSSLKLR
jgi:dsDNA-binding SOS-regulon protein